MNLDDNIYEFIDLYLQGKLDENHPFVQRLKVDEELALEVEVQKLIPSAVVDYRLIEVEKLVSSKKSQFMKDSSSNWNKTIWSASITIVAVVSLFFFLQKKEDNVVAVNNEEAQSKAITVINQKENISNTEQVVETSVKKSEENLGLKKPISPKQEAQKKSTDVVVVSKPLVDVEEKKPEELIQSEVKYPIQESEMPKVAQDPCLERKIKAFVQAEKPHTGKSDGRLEILNTKGGKAPYLYSKDGKEFQDENSFEGLKAGNYAIFVKDQDGCQSIVEANYLLQYQLMEYVFNPNETIWQIPTNEERAGQILIFDKSGQQVYMRNFGKAEKCEWSGVSFNGTTLSPGVYVYKLTYSNGDLDQGRVTIVY